MVQRIQPQPVDDTRLKTILAAEIQNSQGYIGGELADQRRTSMEYYYGEGFGNEIDGQSQVVLTDVADTIEWIKPSLLRIFASGDQVVKFEPVGPEDEDTAKQATDFVNHIFWKDNSGFEILYSWITDALLQKNGVVKSWWDDDERTEESEHTGLMIEQVMMLEQEPSVEIIEQGERPDGLWDIKIRRTTVEGRIKIAVVPPEEFIISRRAIDIDSAPFVGQRTRKTVTELLQMGFDYDQVMMLGAGAPGEGEYNEERVARFNIDDEFPDTGHQIDPAMKEIWIYECYVMLDMDGTGIAERYQVFVGGDTTYEILRREDDDDERGVNKVDDHPFDSLTPIIVPHKFFGRSIADITMDLQQIRSTVLRQLLDNMYNVNNNRTAVWDEFVELDDLLTNRPGGVVRTSRPPAEVMMPVVTAPLGQYAFPLLEWLDDVRSTRTGVTKYNQGLDADTLNDTATGISRIMSAANQRIELYARVFAETGIRSLFRRILRMTIRHQQQARMIQLRGEWVPMDPRSWRADMDATTEVGLGYDNKDQEVMIIQLILQMQEKIIAGFQGGVQGPLVTIENVHAALERLVQAAGLKAPERYFSDPSTPQGQAALQQAMQRPPDPKVIEVQQKGELEAAKLQQANNEAQQKLQLEAAKLQADRAEFQEEMRLKWAELEAKYGTEAEKLRLEGQKAALDANVKREGQSLDAEKAALDAEMKAQAAAQAAQATTATTEQTASQRGAVDALGKAAEAIHAAVQQINAPKRVVRDDAGKVVGVEAVTEEAE